MYTMKIIETEFNTERVEQFENDRDAVSALITALAEITDGDCDDNIHNGNEFDVSFRVKSASDEIGIVSVTATYTIHGNEYAPDDFAFEIATITRA